MRIKDNIYLVPVAGPQAFTEGQIAQMVDCLNTASHMRYSEQRHKKHTPWGQKIYIDATVGARNTFWGIWNAIDDALIGTATASFTHARWAADVGLLIFPPYTGQSIGLIALEKAFVALQGLGIKKVEAGCMHCNDGMMRICEKSGMVVEGWRMNHFQLEDGSLAHMVLWGKML